jgi:hypothetical protein
MVLLVDHYVRTTPDTHEFDWDFIARRNLKRKATWASEDRARHARALAALEATGYSAEPGDPDAIVIAADQVAPE